MYGFYVWQERKKKRKDAMLDAMLGVVRMTLTVLHFFTV